MEDIGGDGGGEGCPARSSKPPILGGRGCFSCLMPKTADDLGAASDFLFEP